MRTTRSKLARRLRTARVNAGLTQAQVAARVGLHRPAISEIEAGRRSVHSDELKRFSHLYCVPVAELLGARNSTESGINRMARIIAERFQPELIILFGSHARGTAGPDSDVDLLVVMDPRGSRRQKAVEIGAALHEIPLPKDIIVTTPEEFAWRKHVIGTIERPAASEGRVLYARR
jgi:uncharacterized protein